MSRSTRGQLPQLAPPWRISASSAGALGTIGSREAFSWLADRSIPTPPTRWHVAIGLDVRDEPAQPSFDDASDTRFHIEIYAEEWGFFFCHAGRASWIRITDQPFVHLRDDFALIGKTPSLPSIGALLRELEAEHAIAFRRDLACVSTNLVNAEPAIRRWISAL